MEKDIEAKVQIDLSEYLRLKKLDTREGRASLVVKHLIYRRIARGAWGIVDGHLEYTGSSTVIEYTGKDAALKKMSACLASLEEELKKMIEYVEYARQEAFFYKSRTFFQRLLNKKYRICIHILPSLDKVM